MARRVIEFLFGPGGRVSTHFIKNASTYDASLNAGGDDILVNALNTSDQTVSGIPLNGADISASTGMVKAPLQSQQTFHWVLGDLQTAFQCPGTLRWAKRTDER